MKAQRKTKESFKMFLTNWTAVDMGKSGKVDYFPVLKLILSLEHKVKGWIREEGGIERKECNGTYSASFILTAAWASCEVWKHNADENPIDSSRFCLHKLHSASELQAVRGGKCVASPRNSFYWRSTMTSGNTECKQMRFYHSTKGLTFRALPNNSARHISSSYSMTDQLFIFI